MSMLKGLLNVASTAFQGLSTLQSEESKTDDMSPVKRTLNAFITPPVSLETSTGIHDHNNQIALDNNDVNLPKRDAADMGLDIHPASHSRTKFSKPKLPTAIRCTTRAAAKKAEAAKIQSITQKPNESAVEKNIIFSSSLAADKEIHEQILKDLSCKKYDDSISKSNKEKTIAEMFEEAKEQALDERRNKTRGESINSSKNNVEDGQFTVITSSAKDISTNKLKIYKCYYTDSDDDDNIPTAEEASMPAWVN
jgi:hypothetical protein